LENALPQATILLAEGEVLLSDLMPHPFSRDNLTR
jgi:hypothetical protein